MKKWTTLTLLLIGMMAQAQTLEQSYPSGTLYHRISSTDWAFSTYNSATKQLVIRNSNHQQVGSITATISESDAQVQLVSRALFDNDQGFEFIAVSFTSNKSYLIDDNGSVIFTFDRSGSFMPINTEHGTKLMLISTAGVQVYGVIGSTFTRLSQFDNKEENEVLIYPNPAQKELTVVSPIEGEAVILDAAGRVAMKVYINQGQTLLQIDLLPSGVYYFTLANNVQSLIIE
jgi:hypothetical protein